jgi:hypothetical protein
VWEDQLRKPRVFPSFLKGGSNLQLRETLGLCISAFPRLQPGRRNSWHRNGFPEGGFEGSLKTDEPTVHGARANSLEVMRERMIRRFKWDENIRDSPKIA